MGNGLVKTFKIYWSLYGGWRALLRSPYVYLAFLLSALFSGYWRTLSVDGEPKWAQVAIDIIPSMLGFSMGGMAIMLAFSNERIFLAITQKGKPNSFFTKVVANFFHFILVQTIALLLAMGSKASGNLVVSGFGFTFLMYAILTGVAIAGQLLHTARIFNASSAPPKKASTKDEGEA